MILGVVLQEVTSKRAISVQRDYKQFRKAGEKSEMKLILKTSNINVDAAEARSITVMMPTGGHSSAS